LTADKRDLPTEMGNAWSNGLTHVWCAQIRELKGLLASRGRAKARTGEKTSHSLHDAGGTAKKNEKAGLR